MTIRPAKINIIPPNAFQPGLSPRMRFDLVVNLLIAKAIKDKKITVFGKGEQIRPFIHIRDISRAIIKILEAPLKEVSGKIYNVGTEEQNISIRDLAYIIKKEIQEAGLDFIEEKEDNRSYCVRFNKIRNDIGFTAEYSIKDAIKEIQEAFKDDLFDDYTDKKYSNYKSLKEN